jgi:hypothetical protein
MSPKQFGADLSIPGLDYDPEKALAIARRLNCEAIRPSAP